jgi:hypothetical protein
LGYYVGDAWEKRNRDKRGSGDGESTLFSRKWGERGKSEKEMGRRAECEEEGDEERMKKEDGMEGRRKR